MFFTASTFRRWLAFLIDAAILAVLTSAPSVFDLSQWFAGHDIHVSWSRIVLLILVPFVYRFGFLMSLSATPGKWLLGLRVVSAKSANPRGGLSAGQAFLRALSDFLTYFFHFAPQAIAFFRADRRQLADLLAGTRVVQFDPPIGSPRPRPIFAAFALIVSLNTAKSNLLENARRFSFEKDGVTVYMPHWDELI